MVVYYEDMLADLPSQLAAVNAFLGLPPLASEEEARLLEVLYRAGSRDRREWLVRRAACTCRKKAEATTKLGDQTLAFVLTCRAGGVV